MTPPTPDLTALEKWARGILATHAPGDVDEEQLESVLALCETVRAQQQAHDADLTRDHAAILHWQARAEQAEQERDALMVQVDQWRRMADREVTACVEMRAERDAARAEMAQLQASNGRLSFALAEAQLAATSSWRCFKCGMVLTDESAARNHFGDDECYAQLRDTSNSLRNKLLASDREVQRLEAEVAQARAERDEWQARATRAEIAQVEARMQDISERQAESVLQAIEDRGLVTWATERDILIRRAEQAEATIATLRAALAQVEWVPEWEAAPDRESDACPWCWQTRQEDHAPDCARQAALGVGRGEGE